MCIDDKADLLSDHFDGKQSIESGDLPATHLPAFAFRSSEVISLLLDSDSCVGTDPFGMLPLFLKSTSDVLKCLRVWLECRERI